MELSLRKQHEWHQLRSWAGRVQRGETQIPQGTFLSHRELCALGLDPGSGPAANTALQEYQSFRALELEASQAQDPVQRLAQKLEAQWSQSGAWKRLQDAQTNHTQINARLDARHSLAAKLEQQTFPQSAPGKDTIERAFARKIKQQLAPAPAQDTQIQELQALLRELAVLLQSYLAGERVASPVTRRKLAAVRQIQAVA